MIDSREAILKDSSSSAYVTEKPSLTDADKNSSFRLLQLVKKPSLRSQDSAGTVSTAQLSKSLSWSDLESSFASLKSEEERLHLKSCMKVKTLEESLVKSSASKVAAKKKSPRFSTLEIRHHPIRLGDNPSVTSGVPLTIDWYCQETDVISVDEYERDRPSRRYKNNLVIPAITREDWLRENGCTSSELLQARHKLARLRREHSKGNSILRENLKECKQSLNRKIMRWILRQPSDRALYDQWREQQVAYCLEKQEEKKLLADTQSDASETESAPP